MKIHVTRPNNRKVSIKYVCSSAVNGRAKILRKLNKNAKGNQNFQQRSSNEYTSES